MVWSIVPAFGLASPSALASSYMKSIFLGRLLAGLATCLAAGGLVAGGAVARSAVWGEQESNEPGSAAAPLAGGTEKPTAAEAVDNQRLGDEAIGFVVQLYRGDERNPLHYVGVRFRREPNSDEQRQGKAFLVRPSTDGRLPFTHIADLKLPDTIKTMPKSDDVLVEVIGATNPARTGDVVVTRMDQTLILPLPPKSTPPPAVPQPTPEPPPGDSLSPAIASHQTAQNELSRALDRWQWSRQMFELNYISSYQNKSDRQRAIQAIDSAVSALEILGDQLREGPTSKAPATPQSEADSLPGKVSPITRPVSPVPVGDSKLKPELLPETEQTAHPAAPLDDKFALNPPSEPAQSARSEALDSGRYRDILIGKITKVDPGAVELSIGAKDGVVVGQTFWAIRGNPTQGMKKEKYANIAIAWVGPDRSVGVLEPHRAEVKAAVGDRIEQFKSAPDEAGSEASVPTVYTKFREVRIPLPPGIVAAADRIESIILYDSASDGKEWNESKPFEPKDLLNRVHGYSKDGVHLFAIRSLSKNGAMNPPENLPPQPVFKVVIDTVAPAIRVVSEERRGKQILLRWEIDEEYLSHDSPKLTQAGRGSNYLTVTTLPGKQGVAVWDVSHDGPVPIQIKAEDLAGNMTTLKHTIPPISEFETAPKVDPLPEQEQLLPTVSPPVETPKLDPLHAPEQPLAAPAAEQTTPASQPHTSHSKSRELRIPFIPSAISTPRKDIGLLLLYVSEDRGLNWNTAGSLDPGKALTFNYVAPKDGEYWFAFRALSKNGTLEPTGDQPLRPFLSVIVDTSMPVIRVVSEERTTDRIKLRWEIDDKHLDPDSPRISYMIQNGDQAEQRELPKQQGHAGEATWEANPFQPIVVTIKARDLAGNETDFHRIIRPTLVTNHGGDELELAPLPTKLYQ
jgi:hypothetical protein